MYDRASEKGVIRNDCTVDMCLDMYMLCPARIVPGKFRQYLHSILAIKALQSAKVAEAGSILSLLTLGSLGGARWKYMQYFHDCTIMEWSSIFILLSPYTKK